MKRCCSWCLKIVDTKRKATNVYCCHDHFVADKMFITLYADHPPRDKYNLGEGHEVWARNIFVAGQPRPRITACRGCSRRKRLWRRKARVRFLRPVQIMKWIKRGLALAAIIICIPLYIGFAFFIYLENERVRYWKNQKSVSAVASWSTRLATTSTQYATGEITTTARTSCVVAVVIPYLKRIFRWQKCLGNSTLLFAWRSNCTCPLLPSVRVAVNCLNKN